MRTGLSSHVGDVRLRYVRPLFEEHEARLKLLKTRELTGDQILTRGRTSRRAARLEIALSTHISLSLGDGVPLALPEQVDTSLRGSILNDRSEEHTSELQSLMRTSYAVFCLKTKKTN